ncbi:hypothetical protein DCM91_10115 [Chitinophaga costaii]|nr:hypothetical protein DCM91_10115 [Chitinophaga costaii]
MKVVRERLKKIERGLEAAAKKLFIFTFGYFGKVIPGSHLKGIENYSLKQPGNREEIFRVRSGGVMNT